MRDVTAYKGQLLAPELDYILLDGSGSMSGKWLEMLAATDAYIEMLQKANLNAQAILHVFDSRERDSVQRDSVIREWQSLRFGEVKANWGQTPLYDAINIMARRIRELDPPRCSVLIVTDGLNTDHINSTTLEQSKAMLDWLRAKGYQVTFFGCDFNNLEQAKMLGSNPSNTIGVQKARLSEATQLLGNKRVRHSRFGDDINFTDDERSEFGGYLGSK